MFLSNGRVIHVKSRSKAGIRSHAGSPIIMWNTSYAWISGIGLGTGLAVLGVIGRSVEANLRCHRCEYEATAGSATPCPECGTDLSKPGATRSSRRVRRPRWIAAGLLVSLICGFGYAITGPFRPTRAQINRYVPAFYLQQDLRDADQATVDAAWTELQDRISHKRLSSSFAAALLQEAMDRQAAKSTTWEPAYGKVVEDLRAAGMVSDAQWALYARRSVVLTSSITSPVPVDGVMRLQLGLQARTGNQDRLGLCTMVYTEPRLESKHLLLNNRALLQNPLMPQTTPFSGAASNSAISMLNGYPNATARYTAVAGKVRFQVPVRIAIVDASSRVQNAVPALISEPLPDGLRDFAPHFEMYAKAPHDTTYRILAEWWEAVDVEVDVVERASLEKDPSASRAVDDRMRDALRSITIELDRSGRRCGATAEDAKWGADIKISALPMSTCFDVLLVDAAGNRHLLATVTGNTGSPIFAMDCTHTGAMPRELEVTSARIILETNMRKAMANPDQKEVYSGTIILDQVPIIQK